MICFDDVIMNSKTMLPILQERFRLMGSLVMNKYIYDIILKSKRLLMLPSCTPYNKKNETIRVITNLEE